MRRTPTCWGAFLSNGLMYRSIWFSQRKICHRCWWNRFPARARGGAIGVVPEESTFLLSWWFLLPCLLVSGFAAYLLVEGTKAGDYPWAHYLLTVALAPILLVSVYAGAIALSGAVLEFLETPQPASQSPSTAPAASENTRPESPPKDTRAPNTTPEDASEASSPSASSSASPTAAPTATPSASPTAPSTASASATPSASPAAPASATASASSAASAP